MSISRALSKRCNDHCELCQSSKPLHEVVVAPKSGDQLEHLIALCDVCLSDMAKEDLDVQHWRCLNDSMWSTEPAVQVMAYRLLHRMQSEGWAQDALDMLYMEADTLEWAQEGINDDTDAIVHRDSNGNVLSNGDTVTLIQDLNVKGASLTAKRGTAVRRIRLVPDDENYIEGKVDGQHIVILTKYVKKQG